MLRDTCNLYFYLCNTSNWNSRLTFPLFWSAIFLHEVQNFKQYCKEVLKCIEKNNVNLDHSVTIDIVKK
jgi:hypothetical protein